MRALVIEDESKIASFVKSGLEAEGFAVDVASDGRAGLEMARLADYDVIVLDLILPRVSGEIVLDRLRARGATVPVIVLTAKDAVSDRVRSLDAGADDYLTKPFSLTELVARIRARLRGHSAGVTSLLQAGNVTLDLHRRTVEVDGEVIDLTSREFALLETFMRHPGWVLSQAQLLDQVWGFDHDPSSNVVEVYVSYLRKKLGPGVIETVRHIGYRFRLQYERVSR